MKKSLPLERLPIILYNIACYLDCLPLEAGLGPGSVTWSALLTQFDGLFRRLVLILPSIEDINPLLRIMVSLLKVPGIQQAKVLENRPQTRPLTEWIKLSRGAHTFASIRNNCFKIEQFFFLGNAGSVFQSTELRHTKLDAAVSLFDGSVLPVSQGIYSRSRQTLFRTNDRVRVDTGHQVQDDDTGFEFPAASSIRITSTNRDHDSFNSYNICLRVIARE